MKILFYSDKNNLIDVSQLLGKIDQHSGKVSHNKGKIDQHSGKVSHNKGKIG